MTLNFDALIIGVVFFAALAVAGYFIDAQQTFPSKEEGESNAHLPGG